MNWTLALPEIVLGVSGIRGLREETKPTTPRRRKEIGWWLWGARHLGRQAALTRLSDSANTGSSSVIWRGSGVR